MRRSTKAHDCRDLGSQARGIHDFLPLQLADHIPNKGIRLAYHVIYHHTPGLAEPEDVSPELNVVTWCPRRIADDEMGRPGDIQRLPGKLKHILGCDIVIGLGARADGYGLRFESSVLVTTGARI